MELMALEAIEYSTGLSFLDVRTALLGLAEDGAFAEYVGDGWFEDDFHTLHIDEMTDRQIAKILMRNYSVR
jgi:hypothetical protein